MKSVILKNQVTSLIGKSMKPYSIDLRKKVVEAYQKGEGSIRKIAKMFSVSKDFVRRLLKTYRENGCVDPQPHGGGNPPKISPELMDSLRALVEENPDSTIAELCEKFEERHEIKVCKSSMGRAILELGLTRKKKQTAQKSLRKKRISASEKSICKK